MLWNPTAVLLALGVAEGLLLAFALATRRGGGEANRLLAALLAVLSAGVAVPLAGEVGLWGSFPRAVVVLSGTPFWVGPLLFAYVARQVREARLFRGRWLALHLVLPAGYALVTLPFLFMSRAELASLLAEAPRPGAVPILPLLKSASFMAYAVASLLLLSRWEARLRERLAEINPFTLTWLRLLVRVALALTFLLGVIVATRLTVPRGDTFFAGTLSLLILAIGLSGLRQPAIFLPVEWTADAPAGPGVPPSDPCPGEPRTAPPADDRLVERLRRLGEEEEILFDPVLNLGRLSRSLGATPHQLSYALNSGLGRSFYEHVNALRAEAVKRRLEDPVLDGTPILELAFACGFSTKATFNKAFRRLTGETPSAWRRHRGPSGSGRTSAG